jgi:integrase
MAVCMRRKGTAKPFFFKFQFQGKMFRGYGFKTKIEAQQAETLEKVKQEALTNSSTFIVLADKRLKVIKAYSTPLWFTTCKSSIKAFEAWSMLPAQEISTEMVRERILEIARERGNKVANRHLVILKAIFNQAIRDGDLGRNPAMAVSPLPVEKARKVIPKREDINKVIAIASPEARAYLELMLFTGARVGEINTLTWDDVDFERRIMRLWTRKKKGGNRKYRTVHAVQRVYDALQLMLTFTAPGLPCPWVFANPTMVLLHPNKPEKWRYIYRDKFLRTLCRRAGVTEFTYHHLRHYTASALAEAGVPIPTIQKILGHERASTTDGYLQDLGQVETALEVL